MDLPAWAVGGCALMALSHRNHPDPKLRQQWRKHLGTLGEELAAMHLQKHGYEVTARNVHLGGGELDLVAWSNDTLCFVEVRSRFDIPLKEDPLTSIDAAKMSRCRSAAQAFLVRATGWRQSRFDAVGVVWVDEEPYIRWLQDAFGDSASGMGHFETTAWLGAS